MMHNHLYFDIMVKKCLIKIHYHKDNKDDYKIGIIKDVI